MRSHRRHSDHRPGARVTAAWANAFRYIPLLEIDFTNQSASGWTGPVLKTKLSDS